MSISVEEIARNYIRYGAKKMGIEDRLNRFTEYIKSRGTKCVETDIVSHYVDSIFLPILSNSEQLAIAIDKKVVPRYYRNRLNKALSTRDVAFIRWFLKNYVVNYADVDALVNQNYQLVPHVFGYSFNVCPIDGATCSSGPSATCVSIVDVQQTSICCTGYFYNSWGQLWLLVDNPPWKGTYMSNPFGGGPQVPTSAGTFTLTGSTTALSCFPTGGVTMGFDVGVQASSSSSGTCTSSCPSGTSCLTSPIYCQCGGSSCTTRNPWLPVLYYNINLVVYPNTNYSIWWSVSVS